MCGVFFKTARFELLDGGHFWLSTHAGEAGQPRVGRGLSAHGHLGEAPAARRRCALLLVQHALRRLQSAGRARNRPSCCAIESPTSPAPCPASSPATSTPVPAPLPTARCWRRSRPPAYLAARRFPRRASGRQRATKARSISSPAGAADGAWTGFWPARISRPSTQRSTTRAARRLSVGSLPRHRDATRPRRHCTAAAGDAARIAEGMKK